MTCAHIDCDRRIYGRQLCARHWGQLLGGHKPRPDTAARLEDAVIMLDRGDHPEHVAARLGCTLAALDITLRRHDAPRRLRRIVSYACWLQRKAAS